MCAPPLAAILALLILAACGRAPTPPPAPPAVVTPAAAVLLAVEADGIYQVSAADLAAAGFDLAAADPARLALSTGGQPVAFEVTGSGRDRALRFFGEALGVQAYTARNAYWLSAAGAAPGQTARAVTPLAARPSGGEMVTTAPHTLHAEEQRQFVGSVGAGDDRWLWAAIFAPGEFKVTLNAADAAPGEALLTVRLWANSSAPANPDHHLLLSLNGAALADDAWDGAGAHEISVTVPAGILRAGENQFSLRAPGDTGAPADNVLLDWVELRYVRKLVAGADGLAFWGQGNGFAVATGGTPAALWDVTDPARPLALRDTLSDQGSVRFASDGTRRRYWLAPAEGALRKPAAIVAVPDGLPWAASPLLAWPGGADWIAITTPELRAALAPLAAARQAAGLRVAVVDVGDVADAFGYGRAGGNAIQAFVRHAVSAWQAPAPRYLLLAGDASYDPRGYARGAEADLVPTHLVNTAFTGWTASDVWFALPGAGADARPALAVGRFPAQNAEQLNAMVAKTLEYERDAGGAAWRRTALLVADNDDTAFSDEANAFAAALTGYATSVVTLAGDGKAARTTLLRAFDDGTGLIGYIGHGSLSLWAQEKILAVEDVAKLNNRARLPVVLTLTCLSGFFQHPATVSLGESFLRAKGGGAVAAITPSSAAVLDDQRLLAEGIARSLAGGHGALTLGQVLLDAQRGLPALGNGEVGGVREIMLTYNLLGDPALRLR